MKSKTKQCQNCKARFTIEPADFKFYKKMDVPEPTFCPDCRAQRRLAFRSGRALYKRKVEGIKEEVFSCISPKSPYKVCNSDLWLTDKIDTMKYGKDYDFNKPFFEQLKELMHEVGFGHIAVMEAVNSPYSNNANSIKDCYLTFNIGMSENCAYGIDITNSKDCLDITKVHDCELNYQVFDCVKC